MPQMIPLQTGLPFFDFQATLDGATYTLQMRWNVRASAWFYTILDETGSNVILAGQRVVVSWPIGAYFTGRQPPGAFLFIDSSGADEDPGLDDLEVRVRLSYWTAAELGLG